MVAPPSYAGLKLERIIGYNGNARDNVIWDQKVIDCFYHIDIN